jgi:hypothetical protein
VIFTVQCVVTTVVVKSKEDVIDTYAGKEIHVEMLLQRRA